MTAAQVISSLFTLEVDPTLTELRRSRLKWKKNLPKFHLHLNLGYPIISVFGVSPFHCQVWHPTVPAPVAVAAFGAMILPWNQRGCSNNSIAKTCVFCAVTALFLVGNTPVFKYLDEPKESLHIDKLQSSNVFHPPISK